MPKVHPTAVVGSECELADDAEIGPYCIVDGRVRLARGVRLVGNNYVSGVAGPVEIGERTVLYPFACVGFPAQDVKFRPGDASGGVRIGEDGILREHVTVHAATKPDRPTTIGSRVFMMVNTHAAHDCVIGNGVTLVNGAGIAGHGHIGDNVTLGGNAVVHQFCRIGRLAFMSGDCAVSLDVPPFCMVNERNRIGGLNLVGLRRSGMSRQHITELRRAFRDVLRRPMPRGQAVEILRGRAPGCPPIAELLAFLETTVRGVTPGLGKPPRDARTWLGARGEREADEVLDGAPADW